MIGIYSFGLVVDVDRFNDIWNHPITAYESEIINRMRPNFFEALKGIEEKVQVRTKMTYADELEIFSDEEVAKKTLGFISKSPVIGTKAQTYAHKLYEYILEINRKGEIVGGEWISETRPDFVWMRKRDLTFSNKNKTNPFRTRFDFEGLSKIYVPIEQ